MIIQPRLFMTALVLIFFVGSWPFLSLAQTSTQVTLRQLLHFEAPDGKDVSLPSGTYGVSHLEGNQLQVSSKDIQPVVIQANQEAHTKAMTQPEALLLPDETDLTIMSLVLLLPDGTGWEAVGSTTGVQSRGKIKLSRKKKSLSRRLRLRFPKKPSSPSPTLPPTIPIPSDCPVVVPYEISGYPPGATDPHAAPNGTQIIRDLVEEVLKSYQPGCWPIKTILVTGHSDKSPGGIQVDDYISVQRAVDAQQVLQQEFTTRAAGMSIPPGYPSPADMNFITGGIGARELDPNGPHQQPENRRVDFLSYQLPVTVELDTTRTGKDFEQHMALNYQTCRSRCASTLHCRAYTYKKPISPQSEGVCFLKKGRSRPSRDSHSISGVVLPAP